MQSFSVYLVAFVAIEHLCFLYLEMFMWTRPLGRRVFGLSKGDAQTTRTLALNQGLYNGFLSAGLVWGLLHSNAIFGLQIQQFFLFCVLVAAIVGGLTVKRSILLMQGLPAMLALASLLC